MDARPTRTVSIGVNPTNIRATPAFANDPVAFPVTQSILRYSSAATIELVAKGMFTYAAGSLLVDSLPAVDETIAINGVTFTFKASSGSATQITIGADVVECAANIAAILNASVNASITPATYIAIADTVYITYDTPGVGGNAYTLADSSAGDVLRSGATLTGGGPASGTGEAVDPDVDHVDVDQSVERYAIASTGTISLDVTDFGA